MPAIAPAVKLPILERVPARLIPPTVAFAVAMAENVPPACTSIEPVLPVIVPLNSIIAAIARPDNAGVDAGGNVGCLDTHMEDLLRRRWR